MRVGVTFVIMLMIWYTSLHTVKILSNSGPVSINGGTIYLNLILEEMIFLKNVHSKLLCFLQNILYKLIN